LVRNLDLQLFFFVLFMSLQAPIRGLQRTVHSFIRHIKKHALLPTMPFHAVEFMLRMTYMYMRLRDAAGHTVNLQSGLGERP
jgi:hypothetical protein